MVCLWLVMVPAAFRCALMILPDDIVLNISASSAETHVHALKGGEAFICLCGPLKPKKKKKKEERNQVSSFMPIEANLHL